MEIQNLKQALQSLDLELESVKNAQEEIFQANKTVGLLDKNQWNKKKLENPVPTATTSKCSQNVSLALDASKCDPSPPTNDAGMNIANQSSIITELSQKLKEL